MGHIIWNLLGFALGAFLFYNGRKILQLFNRLKQDGSECEGVVVERIRSGRTPATVPVISFRDDFENNIKGIPKNASATSGLSSLAVGDKAVVYFDRENPSLFVVDTSLFKSSSYIAIGIGCLCMLINGYSLLF